MDEHRAAAPSHPRAGVVVDFDDEIVQVVLPPEPVAWFSGRAAEGPVVAPVSGILAPGDIAGNASCGQQCPRPRVTVCPPPQPDQRNVRGRAPSLQTCYPDAAASSTTLMARGPATMTPCVLHRLRPHANEVSPRRRENAHSFANSYMFQGEPIALLPPNAFRATPFRGDAGPGARNDEYPQILIVDDDLNCATRWSSSQAHEEFESIAVDNGTGAAARAGLTWSWMSGFLTSWPGGAHPAQERLAPIIMLTDTTPIPTPSRARIRANDYVGCRFDLRTARAHPRSCASTRRARRRVHHRAVYVPAEPKILPT